LEATATAVAAVSAVAAVGDAATGAGQGNSSSVVVAGITVRLDCVLGAGSFGKVCIKCSLRPHETSRCSREGRWLSGWAALQVFRGHWRGRHCAVKVVAYGPELARAVHSEVLLSTALRHPNLVEALSFVQVLPGGRLGLVAGEGSRQGSGPLAAASQSSGSGALRVAAPPLPALPELSATAAAATRDAAPAPEPAAVALPLRSSVCRLSRRASASEGLIAASRRSDRGGLGAESAAQERCSDPARASADLARRSAPSGFAWRSSGAQLDDETLRQLAALADDESSSQGRSGDAGPETAEGSSLDVLVRWQEQRRRQAEVEAAAEALAAHRVKDGAGPGPPVPLLASPSAAGWASVTANGFLVARQDSQARPAVAGAEAQPSAGPPVGEATDGCPAPAAPVREQAFAHTAAAVSLPPPHQPGAPAGSTASGLTAGALARVAAVGLPPGHAKAAEAAAAGREGGAAGRAGGDSHGFLVLELCQGGSAAAWRSARWRQAGRTPDLAVLLRVRSEE
jgi:hypothetical protein